ncbi:MAG: hypothetical protein KBF71_07395 [Alphaproteobacteria bacterium]|jgi:hypothetical protein|nr:hypothetical protein [Alphaproteobacteria bacterium]
MFTTRSKRRIKVPKELWPEILKRISEGDNLQSIADAYDCTIESLSYIMKMTKTRGMPSASGAAPNPSVQSGTLHLSRSAPPVQTAAAPASPTVSPAELTDRLTNVTNTFTTSFMSWQKNPSHDTKTAASDSLHELRKMLVRIEIMLNSKPQS